MKKPLLFPLALAVAASVLALQYACASSQETPTQYARGTFRPPPPALRPGHGLPTFEPRPEAVPLVQPQPKQAPVPHTARSAREDTIWASNPGASTGDAPGTLLGYWLPRPEVEGPAKDELPTFCASLMGRAYAKAEAKGVATNDKRLRRCVVADLYLSCLEHFANKDHALYDATLSSANVFVSKACVGLETSVGRDGIVSNVVGLAEQFLRSGAP